MVQTCLEAVVETITVHQQSHHSIVAQGNGIEEGRGPEGITDIRVGIFIQQLSCNLLPIPERAISYYMRHS